MGEWRLANACQWVKWALHGGVKYPPCSAVHLGDVCISHKLLSASIEPSAISHRPSAKNAYAIVSHFPFTTQYKASQVFIGSRNFLRWQNVIGFCNSLNSV